MWLKWNSNNGKALGSKDNSFKGKFRDYYLINCYDIEKFNNVITTEEERGSYLLEVIDRLDPHEQNIINEYLRFNLNMTNFSNNCGVCRKDLKARVDNIIEKCQRLK